MAGAHRNKEFILIESNMNLLYLALFFGLSVASEDNNSTVQATTQGVVHEFSNWSFVWAFGWLVVVIYGRNYFKNMATDQININVNDEMKKREGAYIIENFKADKDVGALQNAPKENDDWIKLKLAKRTKINHDTYSFRFDFPSKDMEFGLPIGGHVFFYATVFNPEKGKEEEIARKYTPTSTVHQKEYVEFVIKIYRKDENPRFPHGGLMTQYLEKMPIGEYLKMEGPKGKLEYNGRGNFYIERKYQIKRKIGMIAGGSGITPMFQIIQAVVKNKDKVYITLLFGNKSEKDILIREELEQLHEDYPERFKLHYIIDKADHPETWKHEAGYITKEILEKYMPEVGEETIILTCGPKVMNELAKQLLPNHTVFEF